MGGRGASSGKRENAAGGVILKAMTGISDKDIDANSPRALEELKAMAEHGEIPKMVRGNRETRAKIYEEMDKIYPEPSGFLADYRLAPSYPGATYDFRLEYPNSFAFGEYGRVSYPRRMKATESEKRGALKYEIMQRRPAYEVLFVKRNISGNYWDRIGVGHLYAELRFTDSERKAALQNIYKDIERVFGSPVTKQGRAMIAGRGAGDGGAFYKDKDGELWRLEL